MVMSSKISSRRIRDSITFDHIVVFPKDVAYNIERINQSLRVVLDITGCPNCHSGKDILFKDEITIMRNIRHAFSDDFIITKDLQPKPLSEAFHLAL